jgi:hypothetical protein
VKRNVLGSALLTAAVALAVFVLDRDGPAPSAQPGFDHESFEAKLPEFDEMLRGVQRFEAVLRQAKAEVLNGSLLLGDAADALVESAMRDNPQFLKGVRTIYPGRSDRERMMLTLLRQFEAAAEMGYLTPEQRERAERLRQAFRPDGATD